MIRLRQGSGGQVALIDYGAGNLTSVRKAFAALGAPLFTPATVAELDRASAIVVPGVGNFEATRSLQHGWRDAIRDHVTSGTPLLGICLGLQWLFEGSGEAPEVGGVGLFPGMCQRFTGSLKVPHVGWNSLSVRESRLMRGVPDQAQVYFTHSYAAPVIAETVATTEYGIPFSAAVERDNIAAVQFHPEKSGDIGLKILRNWIAGLKPHATPSRSSRG